MRRGEIEYDRDPMDRKASRRRVMPAAIVAPFWLRECAVGSIVEPWRIVSRCNIRGVCPLRACPGANRSRQGLAFEGLPDHVGNAEILPVVVEHVTRVERA